MVNKERPTMSATAPREQAFLLARPEQRLLEAIARRLPARVRPDHLTALALAAAAGFAAAAATGRFWLCAALLVVHWLGDSLDGTLARVRRAERPRYGYYLDHLADAAATALVGLGPRALR
jgi:archaetidylinositol phosphate synthase